MHVDADAGHAAWGGLSESFLPQPEFRRSCARRSAGRWASADRLQPRDGADRIGGCEAGGEWEKRQAPAGMGGRSRTLT